MPRACSSGSRRATSHTSPRVSAARQGGRCQTAVPGRELSSGRPRRACSTVPARFVSGTARRARRGRARRLVAAVADAPSTPDSGTGRPAAPPPRPLGFDRLRERTGGAPWSSPGPWVLCGENGGPALPMPSSAATITGSPLRSPAGPRLPLFRSLIRRRDISSPA